MFKSHGMQIMMRELSDTVTTWNEDCRNENLLKTNLEFPEERFAK
jgi:hypothetical protein